MASTTRHLSLVDRLLAHADNALRTLSPGAAKANRSNPGASSPAVELDEVQTRHTIGLMRINHTGEVCAQALYQGQALTARLPTVRSAMEQAAEEEIDHLAWCEQRIHELGGQTSRLNPLFYALSFGIGAAAGAISDRLSLGFVAATEDQVCLHLEEHLEQIKPEDQRSRRILEQMLVDEGEHATKALEAGGLAFPGPVKEAMTTLSKVMTATTYRW